ncbi:MAG: S1 RNA-binding domain-containing protein, partial [Clostridiales bacterium]|nr:S1 RNA-binding domain-containing protein [Clostridiales bacterium]
MKREIIVDSSFRDIRVALLEDGELAEVYIEKNGFSNRTVGNIYRGKVSSVLPGMQAAFVDIGLERNAFLYVSDVIPQKNFIDEEEDCTPDLRGWNIEELLKPGQEITVQVAKEPIGSKGCRVTTHITLPGRHLVLLPDADYTGVSRRIENETERNKLRKIADSLKPKGMGLIVRTASEGRSEEDFKEDIDFLVKLWESI